jgi:hypothetical protein
MQAEENLDSSLRLQDFFEEYPSLSVCLNKLGFQHPTYLQSEILSINS